MIYIFNKIVFRLNNCKTDSNLLITLCLGVTLVVAEIIGKMVIQEIHDVF